MNRFSWLAPLLLCVLNISFANAKDITQIDSYYGQLNGTLINQDKATLAFNHEPRVDEAVLSAMASLNVTNDQIDWDNSRLYEKQSTYHLKKRVLDTLIDQYTLTDDKQIKYTLQGLIQFIKKSEFAHRVLTPLDPDKTRLIQRQNPKLSGKWLLSLIPNHHQNTITIMGNVFNPGIYQWQHRKDALFYLSDTNNWDKVDDTNPIAMVIQPDGTVQKRSVRQWETKSFQDIAPGAIIYVPFSFIPSDANPQHTMEDPNQLIIELLRSRIQ